MPDARPLIAKVQSYSVAPGDSLVAIARRFSIDVDTLRAANHLTDPDLLFVGQALTVLPVSGVLQVVAPGDTVAALARRYRVPAEAIAAANGLDDAAALQPGQPVLVPGGKPLAITSARGTAWPAGGTGGQRKAQFIAAAVPPAQASQRQTGVPASVTIAQAILESNWGDSLLAREANNFFGIKAYGAAARGGVYWMSAWEVVDGEDVESFEPFRAYTSPEASFADHGLFFRQNSRYWPALYLASEPAAFARAIADAGYATDPAYGAKLVALMDAYQLYQYDVS
jgi:LysM repeat protein